MLDGFSGYNQIHVDPTYREKTNFTTPWGTYMYSRIPFGLSIAGATFQRAMDIDFVGQLNKFVIIYLDDIIVFSNSDQKDLKHLMKVFDMCRKFGIHSILKSLFLLSKKKSF